MEDIREIFSEIGRSHGMGVSFYCKFLTRLNCCEFLLVDRVLIKNKVGMVVGGGGYGCHGSHK